MLNPNDEIRRPLPNNLRQRLRDIPRREVTCRDEERLYRTALSRAVPERAECDPAAERHLATCARCGDLYGALHCAFISERRPLPSRLARRLESIARHPERLLPLWIRDTRYAAAACYLLSALTLALAEDASARFRQTTETVSTRAAVWADAGETRGAEAWDTVSSSLQRRLGESLNHLAEYGERGERAFLDAVRAIEEVTHELIPDRDRSVEGEEDA